MAKNKTMKAFELSVYDFLKNKNLIYLNNNYSSTINDCKNITISFENFNKYYKNHMTGLIIFNKNNDSSLNVSIGTSSIINFYLLLYAFMKTSENDIANYIKNTFCCLNNSEKIKIKDINNLYDYLTLTKDNKESIILNNFNYFYNYFRENTYSLQDLKNILSHFYFVCVENNYGLNDELIEVSSKTIESSIFSSYNSSSTILDFLILMSPENTNDIYDKWGDLIKIVNNDNIISFYLNYLTFKTNKNISYLNIQENIKDYLIESSTSVLSFLNDSIYYANYYNYFMNYSSNNSEANKYFYALRRLNFQAYYTLFGFYDDYSKNIISIETFNKILYYILSYHIRCLVCNIQNTDILKNLYKNTSIYLRDEKKYFNDFINILEKTFPADNNIKNILLIKDIYHESYGRFILEELTNYNGDDTIDITSNIFTIEHIMPQMLDDTWKAELGENYENIHNKYLHTLGNLTLTESNSVMSNNSFLFKKKYYSTSKIKSTNELCTYNEWNETNIIDRSSKLIDIFIKIWKYPEDYKKNTRVKNNIYYFNDNINPSLIIPIEFYINNKTYTVISWKDFYIQFVYLCYQVNPDKLFELASTNSFLPVSRNFNDMKSPYKIDDDIFIDLSISDKKCFNFIKEISDIFDYTDFLKFKAVKK